MSLDVAERIQANVLVNNVDILSKDIGDGERDCVKLAQG
jgi:hypothetical protein